MSRVSLPSRPVTKEDPMPEGFIPPHGGYQQLLAYQKALVKGH